MLHKSSHEDVGKWIWIAAPDPAPNSFIQARRTFALAKAPTSAVIKASADSRYKLFVNGQYVGKGPVRAAEGHRGLDTYDVTHLLASGDNAVAFLVHHIGEITYSYTPAKPGLLCNIEIDLGGEKQTLGTDETWKARRAVEWTGLGARMSHRLGFQEVYDADAARDDWNQTRCNENDWENALVVGTPPDLPWGDLQPRQIPALREEKTLPRAVVGAFGCAEVSRETCAASMPAIMADSELAPLRNDGVRNAQALLSDEGQTHLRTPRGDKGVAIVLDFGREVFGNVEIGAAASGGCIDIGYAEQLTDGRVKPDRDETRYTDRILLGRGRLAWQSFEPRAFRFVQIEFRRCPRPVELDYVRVNQTTYPVRQVGSFECNDKLLNRVWEAGVYTTQLCMQDTFIDCPWRERAQWWGDARILSRAAYYAFDDTALLAQGLRQFASAQADDGSIPGLYPPGDMVIAPDFALLWVFSVLDYYAFSDDAGLVRELYPAVRKLFEWFASFQANSGLLGEVPGRLLIDRADLERRGEVTSLNCFYHQALQVASALAIIADHADDAQAYLDSGNRLRAAINKFMYVPRRGLYAECRADGRLVEKFSRQTNILAALFEITDQYQKAGIFRQLTNGALPELGSPYFASYYLEALYSADRHSDALDYIRRKWGRIIDAGATTLWEDFDFGTQGSLCHGSAVCPTRDLIAEFVGIKPVPGAYRYAVTPHPGDLKWARGAVETRTGRLVVDWRVLRDRLDIEVSVPKDLKVDVYPPGPVDSTIAVDGKHWPSRFVTVAEGSHVIRVTQPKPLKIATYDESPSGLTPHVEVLEKGIRIGRRGIALEPRRRSRRAAKPEEPVEVRMDAATVIEKQAVEPPIEEKTTPAAVDLTEDAKRKRRRRPRGGRGRGKTPQAEPAASEQPREEPVEAPAPTVPQPEHPAEQPAAAKRRRRPRGGRGRKPSPAAKPAPADVSSAEVAGPAPPEPASKPPAAQAEPRTDQPKKRRRTYARRRRPSPSPGGEGRGDGAPQS